jgi:C1A family cysteine protease
MQFSFYIVFILACGGANGLLIDLFKNWLEDFSITIKNDLHFDKLFKNWRENHEFIIEINAKNLTYRLGHNQFSGMDQEEFQQYLGFSNYNEKTNLNLQQGPINLVALPSSVDWVSNGGVTPVKNQGQCGSCWSFSTTGALEGAHYNKVGKLVSFSEQQLVDCDNLKNGGRDHGCNGGLMDNAFSWISKNGGLCSEGDYPYVSGTTQTGGTCNTKCTIVKTSNVVEYVDVNPSSDDAMMSAIAQQPVAIAIQADQKEFQLYKSGVFTGACGTKLDHGVLTVGYGSQGAEDYYLVKNSWGTTWGNGGYILLGRGKQYNNGDGQCGMLLEGSYPVL